MTELINDLMVKSNRREKYRIERLESWLDNSRRLSFRRNNSGFMNAPEGICVLAGIDPELSVSGAESYGWFFLPGALQSLLCPNYPCSNCDACGCNVYPVGFDADYLSLYDAVERRLDKFSSMGFKPNMRIRAAIEYAIECEIEIPWLRSEFIHEKFFPRLPKDVFNRRPRFRGEISEGRKRAGLASAGVNDPAIILSTEVPRLFEELREQGFPDARFKSSGRVNYKRVAEIIFDLLDKNDPGLPQFDSVLSMVRELRANP
jgi:hypothetical protein